MDLMKVLFIGNSYTSCNDLPGMLQEMSNTAGKRLETAGVTTGGKTLEWHGDNPETLDAMDKGPWDFIILQDHSLRAVEAPEKLRRAVTKLVARIRQGRASPVLYVTWARQHLPEMQDAITETYTRVARESGARVAPVGPAWRRALAASPGVSLHKKDRSHPSLLGSYLAACVFYATLYGETPVGVSSEIRRSDGVTEVVDKDTAVFLQETAWASVQELSRTTA